MSEGKVNIIIVNWNTYERTNAFFLGFAHGCNVGIRYASLQGRATGCHPRSPARADTRGGAGLF
jgi:hypothetical protein